MSKEKPIARAIFEEISLDFINPTFEGDSIMKGDFVRVIRDNQVIIEKDQVRILKGDEYGGVPYWFKDMLCRNGSSENNIILAVFNDFQKVDIIEVIERTVKS